MAQTGRTDQTPHPTVLVTGPTASGKSELALALAERLGGEIVSVDSAAVYAGLDVGSAKPSAADRRRVPHHLLDIADPFESYQLARFLEDARSALRQIHRSGRAAILAGGTSMYATALVEGWALPGSPPDPLVRRALRERLLTEGAAALHRELRHVAPEAAGAISPDDGVRVLRALERHLSGSDTARGIDPSVRLVGRIDAYVLALSPDVTRERVERRTDGTFLRGLVDETRRLRARGIPPHANAFRAVGYREALWYLEGKLSFGELRRLVVTATTRLAKRQRTWWRRIPWIRPVTPEHALSIILSDLANGRGKDP